MPSSRRLGGTVVLSGLIIATCQCSASFGSRLHFLSTEKTFLRTVIINNRGGKGHRLMNRGVWRNARPASEVFSRDRGTVYSLQAIRIYRGFARGKRYSIRSRVYERMIELGIRPEQILSCHKIVFPYQIGYDAYSSIFTNEICFPFIGRE